MENIDKKEYWNTIYNTKELNEVSWFQVYPTTSMEFINLFNLPKTAKIIDIGGGDSFFIDTLIEKGFSDITVLDISSKALAKTKKRLGNKAKRVKWIISDVTDFKPDAIFDVWHDRATFHFLTSESQVHAYMEIIKKSVKGFLTIGTFSNKGPTKCSGLDVKQYSEETLSTELKKGFDKIRCITEDHITPFNTKQNFLFCSFKRHLNE